MAVRIEFFTIAGTADFELVEHAVLDAAVAAFDAGAAPDGEPGPVRCVGWLSASDDDEEHLAGWCAAVDDDLGVGLLRQGVDEGAGLASASVDTTSVPAVVDERTEAWSATLRGALDAGVGGRIGWRTNFDLSGTAGTPDDYPTASRALGG